MPSIGQNRAQVTCELLNELNPDVSGDWIDTNINDYASKGPLEFSKYQLVIACDVRNVMRHI
jgi:molybdopterin/thiamine biosynthesis adenylyltransferase